MITFPNAKINLGLNIIAKRADGFHNIETVFYPIELCDVLEIVKTEKTQTSFSSSGLEIPGDPETNLCLKAYNLLKDKFGLSNVKIHLHKVIPMGAGLGGGSSDAAFTLKLLNNLFDLKLSVPELLNYAVMLGSDCAFFILNEPVSAYEKGEQFKKIKLDLSGYQIIIIVPQIHVNTALAYSKVVPKMNKKDPSKIITSELIESWKSNLVNDFEEPIFGIHPLLKSIKIDLYKNGAAYASMSGSGSAVYGLFKQTIDLSEKFKDYFYWSSRLNQ